MKRSTLNCLECAKPHELAVDMSGICHDCATEDQLGQRFALEQQHFTMRVEDSGLPAPLRGLPWPIGTAATAAREWADGERQGLVLTGAVGVGKTYLAGCAAYEMLKRSSLTWLSVADLMMRLRASFSDEGRAQAVHAIQSAGPLVLDDLDKANPTDFGIEVLFAAIDQRIVNGTPLLVTTNLALDDLADRMGDPIASRLAGLGPIEMAGVDRRVK